MMKKDFYITTNVIYNVYSHHLIDFSNNQPQLSGGEVESVISDINYVLSLGNPIVINIYTNSDGTTFANDNKGNPISNRNVTMITYVNPYSNVVNGFETNINGYTSYIFDDNSKFRVYDTDQSYYYYMNYVVPNDIKLLT